MNNRFACFIFLFLIASCMEAAPATVSWSNKTCQFFHLDVGTIGGFPSVGGGYRMRCGYRGCDFSAKTCGIAANDIRIVGLYYPTRGGLYLGAGPSYFSEIEYGLPFGAVTLLTTVGWEKQTKKERHLFIQGECSMFLKEHHVFARLYPSITFGYGF